MQLLQLGLPITSAFTAVQQHHMTKISNKKRIGITLFPTIISSRPKCITGTCYVSMNNVQETNTKTSTSKNVKPKQHKDAIDPLRIQRQHFSYKQQQEHKEATAIDKSRLKTNVISSKKHSTEFTPFGTNKIVITNKDEAITTTETNDMNNLERMILPIGLACLIGIAIGIGSTLGIETSDIVNGLEQLQSNPQQTLQNFIQYVETIGPLGPIVYGIFYFIAELLAIPATPLTMSSGYLFGLLEGFFIVWTAGVCAASITFYIGRTLLRTYVEKTILQQNTQLAKIDKAIANGTNGFKIILLLRLSPLFPFALSNYVYGATSVDFGSYVAATGLGFIPGTLALVVTGMLGKELTLGSLSDGSTTGSHQPWYLYAIGLGVIVTFLKFITDVATDLINAVADEEPTM
jgi:uncharacterized membrane protein YdjX (TVP38/TMEM64 family)